MLLGTFTVTLSETSTPVRISSRMLPEQFSSGLPGQVVSIALSFRYIRPMTWYPARAASHLKDWKSAGFAPVPPPPRDGGKASRLPVLQQRGGARRIPCHRPAVTEREGDRDQLTREHGRELLGQRAAR